MFKDITLGQYYPVDSPVHRLDPRTKLAGTLIYIISLFIAGNIWGYAFSTIFLLLCIRESRVPLGYMFRGLKAILFILLFSVAFNLFLTPGEELFSVWKLTVTKEGLVQAFYMGVRLITLIMGTSLMTFTTTPTSLTDGLERGLGFLKLVKVPVHEIAMMISIALRFIPILAEETDKIMKAQMARGADFETGNVIARAKALVPLLVPLFISAFRRATELAMSMEARCYHGGEGRTKMHPLKYEKGDFTAYAIFFIYLACCILLKIFAK